MSNREVKGKLTPKIIIPIMMQRNHQLLIISSIIVFLLLVVVPIAYADGPIVCASGAGDVTQTNYDLSTCGAPVDLPVYIGLMVKSGVISEANAQLSEGALSCNVYAALGSAANCAVTVRDGVLDRWQASANPENYQLMVSWVEPTPTAFPVFTHTLAPGVVVSLKREFTYGDIPNTLLVSFIVLVMVTFTLWYAMKRKKKDK